MKKGWTITKLLAAGSLGVLVAVLELAGGGIAAATGIIGASGALNSIVEEILVVVCLFVIDEFGAVTIMRTMLGILVLPLPVIGTPGFLPKIAIAGAIGISADLLYLLLKKQKKLVSWVIGAISELAYLLLIVFTGLWFRIPGIEKAAKLLYSPAGITFALVAGAIGGYSGFLIYQKIKDTAVVKRIQK